MTATIAAAGPRRTNYLTGFAGVALVLVAWVLAGRAHLGRGMVVTPAAAVRPILGASRDVYARALRATASSAAAGLAIGSSLAFGAALLASTVPRLRRSISRVAAIANAAPWVAVAPCLLVVLGRDRGPVAVAAIAVFFVVFVSTSVGLGAAPAAARDFAHAIGASRARRVWSIQLPACWPSVIDGLKLAAPAALAGAIFGEWYGAPRGLGVLLLTAMQSGRADRLWAASLLSAACGLAAFGVLAAVRRVATRWYGATVTAVPERAGTDHGPLRTLAVEVAATAALVGALVFAWWSWIEVRNISPLVVPRPSRVWREIVSEPGTYARAAGATLTTAAVAFAIGATVGAAAAVVAARVKLVGGVVVPVVVVLAATPLIAMFPLFARIFGYNTSTVRLLAATMVFFPVFVYTRSGLVAAPPSALDVMHGLGSDTGTTFLHVRLPAAVPHLASGVRIAAGSAVIAAVVGETLIGQTGLGVVFAYSYRLLQLPRAFAAAIVIVVISVAVFAGAGRLERALHARWS